MDKFLWSINFEGVHPVGAVAIVIACDETDACNQLYKTLKPCEPLSEIPDDRPTQESLYETWNSVKKS